MPNSLPYHPFRIDFLKKPIHSDLYLEAFFEEQEPEQELLLRLLNNVAEALAEEKMTSERAKIHREKLDEILYQKGSDAIKNLGGRLKKLELIILKAKKRLV